MNRITELRERVGLSQGELARRVKVTPVRMSQVESTDERAPLKLLVRIAKVLDCGVGELIG